MSKWNAGAAILLGVGERDDRRGAIQDAVVVAVDSSFPIADRRMQTARRWSLALGDFAGVVWGQHDGVAVDAGWHGAVAIQGCLNHHLSCSRGLERVRPPHALGAASIARPLAVCRRSFSLISYLRLRAICLQAWESLCRWRCSCLMGTCCPEASLRRLGT